MRARRYWTGPNKSGRLAVCPGCRRLDTVHVYFEVLINRAEPQAKTADCGFGWQATPLTKTARRSLAKAGFIFLSSPWLARPANAALSSVPAHVPECTLPS